MLVISTFLGFSILLLMYFSRSISFIFCSSSSRLLHKNHNSLSSQSSTLFKGVLIFQQSFLAMSTISSSPETSDSFDKDYPGTAVIRMQNIRERVKSLTISNLSEDWENVRRKVLWAGGLKDLTTSRPGQGYTGHSFNDFNHCDLTAMLENYSSHENDGRVDGIHFQNQLGPGIKIASIEELGEGGSWSTCMMGCNKSPPQDVAHLQFRSKIAFKLVWCPPEYSTFVLVDDDGNHLARGSPTGSLPPMSERVQNYRLVKGSKYAVEAEKCGSSI